MSARIIRLKPENRLRIEAPFGLVDRFALRLRPNSHRDRTHFARTSADVRRKGPGVVIDDRLRTLVLPPQCHQALIGIALSDLGSPPCAQPP